MKFQIPLILINMSKWIKYNPNPHGNNVGDCTVRAISKALGQDWDTTYAGLTAGSNIAVPTGGTAGAISSGNHYEKYIDSKHAYRSAGSPECKERLMNTLEDYMDDFAHQMEEMLRDSECKEEKETIERYLRKLQSFV